MRPSLEELARRVTERAATTGGPGRRVMIGIAGAPGAGKTTLAAALVERLAADLGPDGVAHVPMDGYHLADVALARLGRGDRKGAPDTFDVHGYLALLARLRRRDEPVVYAPAFDREIEQPVAGSIAVPAAVRVVVSEGNYLLMDGAWAGVRELLDEIWYCRPEDGERVRRLIARHERFGKSPAQARAWVARSDEANARVVAATANRADLLIDC
jgi:pantothenate kinase